jgi:hypothetical protein
MSDVIKFLEAMGENVVSQHEFAVAVDALNIDASQHRALLDRDHQSLNKLLGGRSKMMFSVLAAEEDCVLVVAPAKLAA